MINELDFKTQLELLLDHYSQITSRDIILRPEVIEMWWEDISSSLSTEQLKQAVRVWIRKSRWFPTLQDLLDQVIDESAEIYDQWHLVEQAIRQYNPGFNASQYHDFLALTGLDPVAEHVVQVMGSYRGLSEVASKDMPFRREEFVKLYKVYKKREPELYQAALEAQEQRYLESQQSLALPAANGSAVEFNQEFTKLVSSKSLTKPHAEIDPVVLERQRLENMRRNKELAKIFLEQAALTTQARSSVTEAK